MSRRHLLAAAVMSYITALVAGFRARHVKPPKPTPTPVPIPTPTPVPTPTPAPPPTGSPIFGTLATDPAKAAQEYAAGLRLATHETGWDRHEKSDGVFSQPDLDRAKADRDKLLAAGMQLTLEPGLHYPPVYVYGLGRYVNQFGGVGGHPDMTWNAAVRARVERYVTKLAANLDLRLYAAIRVGAGGDVETLFPAHDADGVHTNGYWAYSANAQATLGSLRGLKPGTSSMFWADWYALYLDALVSEVRWKVDLYRSLGFSGQCYVLMPGDGAKPSTVADGIASAFTRHGDVLARGAAWHEVAKRLVGL